MGSLDLKRKPSFEVLWSGGCGEEAQVSAMEAC